MHFDWDYTLGLLWDRDFWNACWVVVKLSIATWCVGVAAGFVLALGKQSRNPLLNKAAGLYIWFFRSLPLLVLLVFIYNRRRCSRRRARCCPIRSTPGSRRWC